jgi:uncharacterized membrane protein
MAERPDLKSVQYQFESDDGDMVSKKRSLAKSLTWRIVAIVSTFVVGYFMTGSLSFAASLTLVSNLINFLLYYLHERVWLKVKWGKD